MIQISQLRKSFGSRPVLRDVNVTIHPGTVTLLVGPNGAGKSTLLRLLAGLSRPDGGSITVADCDLRTDRRNAIANIAYLPQTPRFHPRLTSLQVATFYARLHSRTKADAVQALQAWGLDDHVRTATGKLSGGLRQRLALAVLTLAQAAVLLFDEPGLSLDPEWRRRLQDHLFNEARRGCTVFVATHLLGEWEGQAHRCVVLEGGRIAGELAPARLRESFPAASPGFAAVNPMPA